MKNMKKQFLTFFISSALAAATAFSSPQVAAAHAKLVSAEPAPKSTITEPPKQLKLVFSEKLQLGTSVTVLDASKQKVTLGESKIDADGKTFIVGLPAKLASGGYTVQWRSLSEDGHTERGSYTFKLDAPNVLATKDGIGDVSLKFALMAGKEAVSCGKQVAGLGSKRSTAQLLDARFYLTNLRLISSDGKEVPLALTADNKWQSKGVALLDFEDATGLCKDGGTKETNNAVLGKAPAGKYTGVAFDLGLPFAMNHADVATAKTPLNVQALWWNWQFGYKFARIDLKTNSPAPNDTFLIHLGSTGCGEVMAMDSHSAGKTTMTMTETMKAMEAMADVPPAQPCKNTNLVQVRLNNFDPSKDVIVADLAALLNKVNVAQPKPEPAGCMSGTDDPDCTGLFSNFGLSLKTGACVNGCKGQRLFRVEAAKP
jgi:uncharacterized repeat protein (TIGR04052 family)